MLLLKKKQIKRIKYSNKPLLEFAGFLGIYIIFKGLHVEIIRSNHTSYYYFYTVISTTLKWFEKRSVKLQFKIRKHKSPERRRVMKRSDPCLNRSVKSIPLQRICISYYLKRDPGEEGKNH